MRLPSLALVVATSYVIFVGQSFGQGPRQPLSVRPVKFAYDYYAQDGASPSPSDQVIGTALNLGDVTPAASFTGCDSSCSNDVGCAGDTSCGAASCCDSDCASSSCSCSSSCGSSGCGRSGILDDLDAHCCLGTPWTLQPACPEGCEQSIKFGGWVQFGYHEKNNGLFNDTVEDTNLHQWWLYAEKNLSGDPCSWDWGFRFDIVYGVDAQDTQAFGNTFSSAANDARGWDNAWDHGDYGWAIPQLYLEFGRGDLSVKVGHFYTLVGWEVVTAPDNFFYSHTMTRYNSEPFTHTGAVATYAVDDNIEAYAGWTAGWDTGFDQFRDGSNFLGGASLTLTDDASVTYTLTAGDFGARGSDGYGHSVVADISLTDNLQYVFQTDVLRVNDTGEDNAGINQYLIYTLNDCLALASRFEWWKADGVTGFRPYGSAFPTARGGSSSYYSYTVGANVRPHANIVVRPEVRHDWSPTLGYDEMVFGVDTILTY